MNYPLSCPASIHGYQRGWFVPSVVPVGTHFHGPIYIYIYIYIVLLWETLSAPDTLTAVNTLYCPLLINIILSFPAYTAYLVITSSNNTFLYTEQRFVHNPSF